MNSELYVFFAFGMILCAGMEFGGSHYQYQMAMLTIRSGGVRVKRKNARKHETYPLWDRLLLLSLLRTCRQDRFSAGLLFTGNLLSLAGFLFCVILSVLGAAFGKRLFLWIAGSVILVMVAFTVLFCETLDIGGKSKRYAMETPLEILAMACVAGLLAWMKYLGA